MISILYPLILLIPPGLLALLLRNQERTAAEKGLESPIGPDEKFLRSPGESVLKWKKELDAKILGNLLLILTSAPCLMVSYLSIPNAQRSSPGFWIIWAFALPVYAWFFVKALLQLPPLWNDRRNKELGFRGERAVGEYLNQLMLDGCRVFHDFPLNDKDGKDHKCNLDHIVVAPSGVYAIETKTRRKRSRLTDNHVVTYDGKKLVFPDWIDTEKLQRTRDQADQLTRILKKQLKKNIDVHPVLTLPGWFIDRRGKGDVNVLNHKEIAGLILGTEEPLSTEDIEKISAFLDGKCRDVAF